MNAHTTVTLTSIDEVFAAIPRLIGFVPTDSIVVIGVGGGPIARVDATPPGGVIPALRSAYQHWSKVIIAGIGADTQAVAEVLGVDMVAHGIVVVTVACRDRVDVEPLATGTDLDAVTVAPSRADLDMDAASTTDADEAERLAWAAYEAGNGALAWVYHDRATVLAGVESPTMADLAARLDNAVPPSSFTPSESSQPKGEEDD